MSLAELRNMNLSRRQYLLLLQLEENERDLERRNMNQIDINFQKIKNNLSLFESA